MKKLLYLLKRFFSRKPDIWSVSKFQQFHVLAFCLLSFASYGQSRVFLASEIGERKTALLNARLGKVQDTLVFSDGITLYNVESDVDGSDAPNSKVRISYIQLPFGTLTTTQKKQVEDLYASFAANPAPLIIDDSLSQQIIYSGTWAHVRVVGQMNNTISYSGTTNSTIEIGNLTGKSIELYFERKNTHGMAEIFVNGVAQTPLVNLYSPTELKQQLVFSKALTAGVNTIKIRVTGAKDPLSSSTFVVFDYLKVIK